MLKFSIHGQYKIFSVCSALTISVVADIFTEYVPLNHKDTTQKVVTEAKTLTESSNMYWKQKAKILTL